jgi:hypothetical protein
VKAPCELVERHVRPRLWKRLSRAQPRRVEVALGRVIRRDDREVRIDTHEAVAEALEDQLELAAR